jgi:hypothetical protein
MTMLTTTTPNWDELLPNIFHDSHFHKSSRRRWQGQFNGARAGIVVAWRPADYDNYALNKADIERLLELRREATFDAAFVVLATVSGNYGSSYVGHRDAEEFYETLKVVRFRTGPHGDYWLLREDFSPLDAEMWIPF